MPANESRNDFQQMSIDRITRAIQSEKHYRETDDSPQQQLRDLLTDIRHYAEANKLDLYAAIDGSYDVYLEERC